MKHARVTTADIARVVGVSRSTVGFVLNDTPGQTISAGTRQRVLEAAERMGYRRNNAARALASGRSHLVLLVLPDWPVESGLRQLIEAASRRLAESGYALVTHTPSGHGATRPLWESLQPDVVLGLEFFSASDVASMRKAGVQHVVPDPDRPIPLGAVPGTSEGALAQVDHLVALGHRRLAFAGDGDPRVRLFAEARRFAAQRHALDLDAVVVDACDIGFDDGSVERALARWADTQVTAVLAYNDAIAALVAGAALRAGLRVPEDLAVIGHDDSPLARLFVPSLSSIRQDSASAGRLLAGAALRAMDGTGAATLDTELDLRTELVIRESTAGTSAGSALGPSDTTENEQVPA